MMNPLFDLLKLEYKTQFNIRKAFAIVVGAGALIFGTSFLNHPDSPYRIIGIASIMLFMRIVLGSPVEEVLTDESRQRLKQWVEEELKKNGKDESR
jgi:hypothetical protein